jgi:hypothetical protein
MYEVLTIINDEVEFVLGPYAASWYSDWKLWVGGSVWASMWAKWLIYGYDHGFHTKACFVFACNLWCLAIVQHDREYGLILVITICLGNALMSMPMFKTSSDIVKDGGFRAKNVYASLEKDQLQVSFIFTGQVLLIVFVLYSMYEKLQITGEDAESEGRGRDLRGHGFSRGHGDITLTGESNMTYVFWMSAYVAVQMTSVYNRGRDSALGSVFSSGIWENIYAVCDDVYFQPKKFDAEYSTSLHKFKDPIRLARHTIVMRAFMDFVINGIAREVIAMLLPLLLMTSYEPLDFVMDSLAVTYISTLDDMTEVAFKVTVKGQHPDPSPVLLSMPSLR